MIERVHGNLRLSSRRAGEASVELERDGYALLRNVLTAAEIVALGAEISAAFERPSVWRSQDEGTQFRHEMLNRSAACQSAVAHLRVLEAIEPLLGTDCHVIANTAWRNSPEFAGGSWHCDAGPHIPRPEGVPWDARIPYPIFAIGAHLYLQACPRACGPTAVVPGSHRSGRLPPSGQVEDEMLSYQARLPVAVEAEAGDVALFVSDIWHRGLPAQANGTGRFFLQVHYARRDIAQRLRTTDEANQLSAEAVTRARTPRERTLIGLHDAHFYDG